MTNELSRGGALPSMRSGADRYVQALLTAGEAGGHISPAQAQGVRLELERMLTTMAVTYTFGASGSMPAETAKQLLASAAFAIGLALKASPSPEAALHRLMNEPPDTLRREGIRTIDEMSAHAQKQLVALAAAPVTHNRAYLDTINHGLPLFFASYDKTYAAHENPGSIDYPLCADVSRLTGIEYTAAYIDALTAEAALLSRWTQTDVDALLRGYSPGWRELLVNAYEPALTNTLGRVLCGHSPASLGLSAQDRASLAQRFAPLSSKRLQAMLGLALERLKLDTASHNYAASRLRRIADSIIAALDTGHPESVFITPAAPPAPAALFTDGMKLSDECFRALADELRECRCSADRLSLIRHRVTSLEDLTDLLGADVLSGSDFAALFASLDAITLRQLAALLPEDSFHSTCAEQEWHTALAAYIRQNAMNSGSAIF